MSDNKEKKEREEKERKRKEEDERIQQRNVINTVIMGD